MKTTLSIIGLAATLLFALTLPACAAGPRDNSPSTSPSVEPQRPQTTPANTTATFYYWDHLGTVRMTAGENPTAETVERHDYEPYGLEMLPATNQAGNTHQFTGHERDLHTGIDYMHARYYGSNLGRFLKPDPGDDSDELDPQSWNQYAYVRNNPVNHTDPTGQFLDVVADVGFLIYDALDIAATATGGERVSGTQWTALGADAVAAVVPFATGAGVAVRLASKVDKVADVAKAGEKVIEGAKGTEKVLEATKGAEKVADATKAAETGASGSKVGKGASDNWQTMSAHTEPGTKKGARQGGVSIQEIQKNPGTGETRVQHTVVDDKGKVVDSHSRPMYKPRKDEVNEP